ncbi:MAG: hemolysin family protein [Bacilli bacterium]
MLSIDPSARYLWIILVLILVFCTSMFSACETALTSCNQFKFKVLANEGNKTAKLITKFIDNNDKSIITILVGINVVTTVISTIATVLLVAALGQNAEYSSLIATLIITVTLYIFGDTIPKILARAIPDKFIVFGIYLLTFCYYLFYPFTMFFYYIALGVKKLCKIKEKAIITEEEFSAFIDDIEDKGMIDEDESDIIQSAIDFADTSVKECLTPLTKMQMINIVGLTNVGLNAALLDINYSRIPVYDTDPNNIVGILNVKKYFNAYMDDNHVDVRSILSKPYFVDSSTKIDDIFNKFQSEHVHIAIIKNNNVIIGMITMEDILEELVGEIAEPLLENKKGDIK